MPYKQVDDGAARTMPRFCATRWRRPIRSQRPPSAAPAAIRAAAATKLNEVPDLNETHRAATGRDARRGGALYRSEWRPRRARRHQQPWRRTSSPVLPRLAGGAEDARFRRPQPERAGRLPVHQEDLRTSDRADRFRPRGQSAAQDRQLRHSWRRPRQSRPRLRSGRRDDSVHAGAAHRARQQGVRVARGGDEKSLAPDGIRRRLETAPSKRSKACTFRPANSQPSSATCCSRRSTISAPRT